MPDKSIREFVRERMHEGNGGRLHLHFDATRKAYPRKVVPFGYVQRIATEWFRDGGHLLKEHAGGERFRCPLPAGPGPGRAPEIRTHRLRP